MYDIEQIYTASDVTDALCALQADQNAIVIAGGSDVLIKVREGKLAGCSLVSIHGLPELQEVHMEADGTLVIGAGMTFSHLTAHPLIRQHVPMLGNAVDQAGGPQLRNVGTIGGNVCNGATSADSAASLMALNARLVLRSADGMREVSIHDFYTGPGRTVRERTEILTEIRIRREDYAGYGGHYIKYGKRNAMEIATLGCACMVKLTDDRRILDARLAYGVAAPTPIRCRTAEQAVRGLSAEQAVQLIGEQAIADVNPRSSWRASKEFRLQLVRELAKRAMKQAIRYAGGEPDA